MRLTFTFIIFLLLTAFSLFNDQMSGNSTGNITASFQPDSTGIMTCRQLYAVMQLNDVVNYTAFEQAITGYKKICKSDGNGILSLIDYSKPSTEKRFYVLDLNHKQLLFRSYVAHGKNSGENYATSFSNKNGSHQSSLGFYRTGETYEGKNGYSLILNGLEKGINDHARARAIVIHGAPYCDPRLITSDGRLGRSFGCPALPESVNDEIINTIKGGTLLYIYANNTNYLTQSRILVKNADLL
jgi:hypothetical protein